MASFDYRDTESNEISERFQGQDIENQVLWSSTSWTEPGAATEFFDRNLTSRVPAKKRLFISHKSADTKKALEVVTWCRSRRLDYWLDVLDPRLSSLSKSSPHYAVTIAAIIEMALSNCTHVLVVYTDAAAESRWVPYEYGRVKIPGVRSLQAAAWDETTSMIDLPEYMSLGAVCQPKSKAKDWVNSI